MQDVIIVCAGGYGTELYCEINEINRNLALRGKESKYKIVGFLSDVAVDLGSKGINSDILGTIEGWYPRGNEKYVIGLSRPAQKKKVSTQLREKGARFETIISAYARIPSDLEIGEGCFITGGSRIACGVRLGDFVNINGSMICGGATIGSYSTATGYTVVEEAVVGEGVFIGSKAVITEGCTVGEWSQVSAGSVVTQDIRPFVTVFGMPAQEIG